MYNSVSSEFISAITQTYQKRKFKAEITYKDSSGTSTTKTFNQDEFVAGSFSLQMSCMPTSSFDIGGVIAQDFSISIYNNDRQYNGCKFQNGIIKPYFGIIDSSGDTQWCPLGYFIIDQAGKSYNKTISIKAVDQLMKFEKSMSGFEFGSLTLAGLLQKMCEDLGINCNLSFINSNYQFTAFDTSELTYRDVLGYIAAAAGGFARMSKDNILEIVSFNIDTTNYFELSPAETRLSCDVDEPVVIDSVAYYVKEGRNKLIGDGLYSLTIENNILFDNLSDLDGLLNSLYSKYNGFTYYPFECEYMGDPRLEPGDTVLLKKTVEGDIFTFVNKQRLGLSNFSKIETPVCDELDKNFLDSYKSKNNSSGGGGGTVIPSEKKINENLLLTSLFIKPFFPRNYVQQSTAYPIESLQLDMLTTSSGVSSGLAKVWLPFQGLEPGETYTFSVLLRSYSNKNQKLALTMINYTNGADIFQVVGKDNLPLDAAMSEVVKGTSSWLNTGVAFNFGEIKLTDTAWNWHTLTFTTPTVDQLGWDIGSYILCLGVNQATTTLGNTYKVFIQKAKLEKGSEATEWCLGKGESIEGNFTYQEQNGIKLIKKTNTAVVKSNISDYESRTLHLMPCIRLYDALHGVTQICYQEKRNVAGNTTGEDLIVPEITFCTNNNMYGAANTARLFMDENKAIRIISPGGLYLNDTQIS